MGFMFHHTSHYVILTLKKNIIFINFILLLCILCIIFLEGSYGDCLCIINVCIHVSNHHTFE